MPSGGKRIKGVSKTGAPVVYTEEQLQKKRERDKLASVAYRQRQKARRQAQKQQLAQQQQQEQEQAPIRRANNWDLRGLTYMDPAMLDPELNGLADGHRVGSLWNPAPALDDALIFPEVIGGPASLPSNMVTAPTNAQLLAPNVYNWADMALPSVKLSDEEIRHFEELMDSQPSGPSSFNDIPHHPLCRSRYPHHPSTCWV